MALLEVPQIAFAVVARFPPFEFCQFPGRFEFDGKDLWQRQNRVVAVEASMRNKLFVLGPVTVLLLHILMSGSFEINLSSLSSVEG